MTNSVKSQIPVALTIAGSDSGGGAGIQADLRTFAFHCIHGASALTCVTAQNTLGVTRVDALPPDAVTAQIEAVVTDIGVQAFKTGMLLNKDIMKAVARQIKEFNLPNFVLDPVMVSRTGSRLIDEDAIRILRDELIPLAKIVTPNRDEAEILSDLEIFSVDDMEAAAYKIHRLGAKTVLIKGGGMKGELRGIDVWFDGNHLQRLKTVRVDTTNSHGTGCTLSAAIVANLALGKELFNAVKDAKSYVTTALKYALSIGKGQGPVGHFFPLLERE